MESSLPGDEGQTPDGAFLREQDVENVVPLSDNVQSEGVEDTADGTAEMDEDDQDGAAQYQQDDALEDGVPGDGAMQTADEGESDAVAGFLGHSDAVFCVAVHPELANVVASGGGDDRGFIWDISNGQPIVELSGHGDSVSSVQFSGDGKLLATGSFDSTVKIWGRATPDAPITMLQSLEGPSEGVEWLSWHPKGPVILAGAGDGSAWMWNASSGQYMQVFSGHGGPVTCGGFSIDGKFALTASDDGTMRVWDPKSAECKQVFQGHTFHSQGVTCMAMHPTDAAFVLTGSQDATGRLSNIHTGKVLGSLAGHEESVEAVGLCGSLPLGATGGVDGKLIVWDLNTLQARSTLAHDDAVSRLRWHPTQPLLFSCSADRTVRLWDARTGRQERRWRGHKDTVLDIAVSRDGSFVVSCSDDHSCLVFRC